MPSGPCASPERNWRTNALSELKSSSAGPDSTMRPFHRTAMYSATRRALMMSWVMTTYAPPFSSWISWMSSHSSAVRTGSRPESGSSKSTMSGSSTSARAKPARLRMPPESSLGILSPESCRPTSVRRRLTMSRISSSPLSVCWRRGKATLSSRFIEPKSAPSWKRTPNFLRISNSSASCMFGTDSPWTRMSPSSGYSRPTMCLMHTDFPVPDGPRIIEILSFGKPMFRPRRILLRPKALCTSTNSTASLVPCGRSFWPVCHLNSSSSPSWPGWPPSLTTDTREGSTSWWGSSWVGSSSHVGALSRTSVGCSAGGSASWVCSRSSCSLTAISASDWCSWIGPPEDLGPQHADEVHEHDVQHHGLRGRGADAYRSPARVVAVVAPDEDDGRGHDHALDHRVQEVWWVLEHPEDQEEPARGDLAYLLDHRQVAGEEAGADGGDVHEGQDHPARQQARRAEEEHRVDAHHFECVDLVGDPHRAQLGDDAGADLRGHHVAEGVRDQLAQVAPGGEDARVRRGADRAVEVRALDAALQADDEDQAPDDERRAQDEDAGLAQGLAEEAEDPQRVDLADDLAAELRDLAEAGDPVARDCEPTHQRMTWIS